jgi:tetratricopeptide (TPR) repeat protein
LWNELTEEELQRLTLDQLVGHGRQALREQAYGRAAQLLRTAARRAPFRQDVREWLAMAIEGAIDEEPAPERPATPPRTMTAARAMTPPATSAPTPRPPAPRPEPRLETPPPQPPEPTVRRASNEFDLDEEAIAPQLPLPGLQPLPPRPVPTRTSAALRSATSRSAAPRSAPPAPAPASAADVDESDTPAPATVRPFIPTGRQGVRKKKKPSNFERRHERGPLSAWLWGAMVGLVLIAAAGVGVWVYLERTAPGSVSALLPSLTHAREQDVLDAAYELLARGETALAVDKLNQLPVGPARDHTLAQIHMSQGDSFFKQQPPNYQAAIDDYNKALELEPANARYGNALALAYYTMGRAGVEDPAQRDKNLGQALRIYQSVLDLNSASLNLQDKLTALKGQADAAVGLRDDATAAKAWRAIIAAAPDSDDAKQARANLTTRGFKIN